MKFLACCLSLLSLMLTLESQAQVYLKSEYNTSSSYWDDDNKKTEGNGDVFKVQGGFTIPLSYKQNETGRIKMWALSLDVIYANFNNKNIATDLHPDNILNTSVSLSHLRPIGKRWSLFAMLGGGIYSDPSDISGKNILGSGGVVFIYHLRDNLDIGLGVGVSNDYGLPMGLPMTYVNWQIDGKYELKVSALQTCEISGGMKISDHFKLRLIGIEVDGMSAVMKVDGKSKIFGSMSIKSGLQAEFNFGKSSAIQLTGGGNWYRDACVVNRSIKDFFKWWGKAYDPCFDISGYFSIGYKYGF